MVVPLVSWLSSGSDTNSPSSSSWPLSKIASGPLRCLCPPTKLSGTTGWSATSSSRVGSPAKTSVVWTQWQKPEQWQRQWQQQSRLIQMNPGLPGLFILVGGWWLLCSAGVLICCQWSVAVQALCYQGSGIGGPMESKHRTCPLLIYPRRNSVCIWCVCVHVCLCKGESGEKKEREACFHGNLIL